MKALVTGAAGFIGSHLAETLVAEGHEVIGLDCFSGYYGRDLKEFNIKGLRASSGFQLVEADLGAVDLGPILDGCDVIFHLAAQPGVRPSWGPDFRTYIEHNIWATQRLLEAVLKHPVGKFVFASTSSVYGEANRYPTREDDLPKPISPYGVTKLAAEKLCLAYHENFGVPVVAVRYFTVYGPRQRPDMAFSRFIRAIESHQPLTIYGDGNQRRDFTYVGDAVAATIKAGQSDLAGEIFNVAGGSPVPLLHILTLLKEISGQEIEIDWMPAQPGDVSETGGDLTRIRSLLGYDPQTPLAAGLRAQVDWIRQALSVIPIN